MLFDKKFDLIFGIGEACSCSETLRRCQLQFASYPYDWLFGADIITRVKILANNYANFIDFDDLEDLHSDNKSKKNLCELYKNKRNNIVFNHDFPYGKPIEDTYEEVRSKYARRAERLISRIESSKRVLVVYLQCPNNRNELDNETLKNAHKILQDRFPKQEITLLYLYCKHEDKNYNIDEILDNIIKVSVDYDKYSVNVPFAVNNKVLDKFIGRIKISNKFLSIKNIISRNKYLLKRFWRTCCRCQK